MQAGPLTMSIGFLMMLIGLWGVWAGRKHRAKALASASWPHVTGTITEQGIAEEQRTRRVNDNDTYETVYRPHLTYDYQVGGRSYAGRRIGFADLTQSSRARAQKILDAYPTGSTVKVHYDPSDPASATLDTTSSGTMTGIVLAAIVTVAGAVAAGVGLFVTFSGR
jgi:hypothetical protein